MADRDSSPPNHNHHPNPFMQNPPLQHGTPQSYVFCDSAVQNRNAWDPTVVETPESFAPRNLRHYQGSGSGWLNQVENSNSNSNNTPGLEDLESSMQGLSLWNPFGNTVSGGQYSGSNDFGNTASVGQYSGSNDVGNTASVSQYSGYEFEKQLLLQKIRINAAATALRVQDLHSRSVPNHSNFYPTNSDMSNENGLVGSSDHYRFRMNRSNSLLTGKQPKTQQHHNLSSLEGLRGQVVSMAKDQCGCRFLQMKIDEGTPEDIEMILSEVQDHLHELMTHHFGNYLIQKIFEARSVSVSQMDSIFLSIIQDVQKLKDVCIDNHGTRAIQRMLGNLKTPMQRYEVICVMRQITVPLMKNVNGGYVIQQCVKLFPPALKKVILDEVARNCVNIATDKSGCSVIQKCISHAGGEAIVLLVQAIIFSAVVLAENPYGNYVVTFLLEKVKRPVNAMIISELRGRYVQLSMNKHGSHVVEHLLQYSEEKHAAIIVLEIMDSHEFLNVLQDPYGNFVAQTALECSKGTLRKRLSNSILSNYGNLHSHLYGKRVLDFAKGCKIRF